MPHLLVLNKEDLVCDDEKERIVRLVKISDPLLTDVIFTNCKDISKNKGLEMVSKLHFRLILAVTEIPTKLASPKSLQS